MYMIWFIIIGSSQILLLLENSSQETLSLPGTDYQMWFLNWNCKYALSESFGRLSSSKGPIA